MVKHNLHYLNQKLLLLYKSILVLIYCTIEYFLMYIHIFLHQRGPILNTKKYSRMPRGLLKLDQNKQINDHDLCALLCVHFKNMNLPMKNHKNWVKSVEFKVQIYSWQKFYKKKYFKVFQISIPFMRHNQFHYIWSFKRGYLLSITIAS